MPKPPTRPLPLLVSCLLLAGLGGCNATTRMPDWSNPGNAATQRYNAIIHDPYPLPDAGPPIVGGRPRGYQVPVPEVTDGRLRSTKTLVVPPR